MSTIKPNRDTLSLTFAREAVFAADPEADASADAVAIRAAGIVVAKGIPFAKACKVIAKEAAKSPRVPLSAAEKLARKIARDQEKLAKLQAS